MKIFVATVPLIALLLGNSVNLRASATGPDPSDGDGLASQACPMCCQGPAAILGIPVVPGSLGTPGSKGDAGQKGDIGPIGSMGERGAVGDTGPKGDVGITGQTGVKGQKGEPGAGATQDDSNQRIAFTVRRSSQHSDTSTSHDTPLPFQATLTLLPGTSFNLETSTFTCGVPGTYVFMFSVLKHSSTSGLWVHLWKNGDHVVSGYSSDSSHYEQVSGSAVQVLQRGDIVHLTMYGRAHGGTYTSFSGFLLYPE